MAYRDRSQGIVFAYVDIADVLRFRPTSVDDIQHPSPTVAAQTPHIVLTDAPAAAVESRPDEKRLPSPSERPVVQQVKQNLDRLQSLHHKLHAMLEELNQLTKKDRKG